MVVIRLVLIVLLLAPTTILAAEISFFCTDALAPSIRELVPAFEKASGHRVKITVANAGTVAERLQSGEPADLAIVLPPAWDRLRREGRIDSNTRIVLGKVGLGAFVRIGAEKPDIRTVDAFKRAVLDAKSIAIRDPAQRSPVGTYMLGLFDRLALSNAVKPRLVLTTEPPYEEVINSKAELGFSTLAEIAAQPRVALVGPLPGEIQSYNVFTVAIPVSSGQRAATNEFLQFLMSDSSKAMLRSKGIDTD